MLFKSLGYITSFGNLAVIYGLTSNGKITDFWSANWLIGMGSILFLSLISTSLFYLNNKNQGINVLKIYGGIYGLLALSIYGYWGIDNLINPSSFNEFQGNFVLFSVLSLISFFSIRSYMKEYNNTKLLFLISSILSVITIGITFATIYKYVFLQKPFGFDQLLFEMFVIGLGSILFIGSHTYAVRNA